MASTSDDHGDDGAATNRFGFGLDLPELQQPSGKQPLRVIVEDFDDNYTPTFLEAMEPIASVVKSDGFPRHGNIGKVSERVWEEALIQKYQTKLKDDAISDHALAGVMMYTRETQPPLYRIMVTMCSNPDRTMGRPYAKLIWLILTGLRTIRPTLHTTVFRGKAQDQRALYPEGKIFHWMSFTSSTTCLKVLENPDFCGKSGPRTIFVIFLTQLQAREIASYSVNPHECEVMIPPGCRFRVVSVLDQGELTIINIEELPSEEWLMDLSEKTAMQKVFAEFQGSGRGVSAIDWGRCFREVDNYDGKPTGFVSRKKWACAGGDPLWYRAVSEIVDGGFGDYVTTEASWAGAYAKLDDIMTKLELLSQACKSDDEGLEGGDADDVAKGSEGKDQRDDKIGDEIDLVNTDFNPPSRKSSVGTSDGAGGDAGAVATGLHWSMLPDYGLESYIRGTIRYHKINTRIKGLRVVSEDPWVIILPGLLNRSQCEALMKKAEGHYERSVMTVSRTKQEVSNARTSSEVRLHPVETPFAQKLFAKVLDCKVSELSPAKVIWYEKGQHFATHHDGNRKAVMFVYLNTVASGGATSFDKLSFVRERQSMPLLIQPEQGLAVIHFPAVRRSRSEDMQLDFRTNHSGLPAESPKFLCFQALPCQGPTASEMANVQRHGIGKV